MDVRDTTLSESRQVPEILGECFDPQAELLIESTCRPHWSQSGAIVFATLRLDDSIPASVFDLWDRQRVDWLKRAGHECNDWRDVVGQLSEETRRKFQQRFNRVREKCLDNGCGACVLRDPRCAEIVAQSLLHFDGIRYRMGDFVVMPNHIHLLCAFENPQAMRAQFDSWQHYTAFAINKVLGRKGKLWQGDPFDHLVRSPDQYLFLRQYIRNNPWKARLAPGTYRYRRYPD